MFRKGTALLAVACVSGLLVTAACGSSSSEGDGPSAGATEALDPNYFAGKTINMLVAGTPGGGVDLNARFVGSYLTKYLPGKPTIVYTAMTAGAGIQVANTITTSKPDGLTIGAGGPGLATYQAAKQPGVAYDASKFEWIGGPADVDSVIFVRTTTGVTSVDQMKTLTKPIVFGAGPKTNLSFILPELLKSDAKWNITTVAGLGTNPDILLAFDRGDTAGGYDSYQALATARKDWLDKGTIKIIARHGTADKSPALAGVPQVLDLLPKDASEIVELLQAGWGRPVFAPPGTPANVMKAYHDAMKAAMADPGFAADAAAKGVSPTLLTGAQDLVIAKKLLATPAPVIERYKKIVAG